MNEKMIILNLSKEEMELIKDLRKRKEEDRKREENKIEALKQIEKSVKTFLENGGDIFITGSYGIWQKAEIKFQNNSIYVDIM